MRTLKALAVSLVCSSAAAADPYPMGLDDHPSNGSVQPVTEDGVTRFEIRNHECSDYIYPDGRGESDCRNGNIRSNLGEHDADVPGTWTYEFEFRVLEPVSYWSWINDHSCGFLEGCLDSRLRIASWEGNELHNFLYMLKLDGRHGVRFLDGTCVGQEELYDGWTRFRMEVQWSNDESGWIRVSCDDRVTRFREGVRTAEAPHCYVTNLCIPGETKRPSRVTTILGPVMQGFGPEWQRYSKSHQFTDFGSPIRVEMRNVAFTPGPTLYDDEAADAVRDLQSHLVALGCDPGPVDGVMGSKTRESAFECRDMADVDLPEQINAETVSDWLTAYEERHPL